MPSSAVPIAAWLVIRVLASDWMVSPPTIVRLRVASSTVRPAGNGLVGSVGNQLLAACNAAT